MQRLFLHAVMLLLTGAGLSACSTVPVPEQPALQRPAQSVPDTFALNGRIAVQHEGKRHSSGVYWSHTPSADEILMLAPLGQTVGHLVRNAQGVTLEVSGKRYAADNTEQLTQHVLGWQLPLEGLRYWVFALPAPGRPAEVSKGAAGQVEALQQDGWLVRFPRYLTAAADSLPQRMIMSRPGLEIQLLVDTWDIPQ